MKFFFFHLMPFADLDLSYDQKYDSAWVTLPNSYYDPAKGHRLYNRYIDELVYADELGFDGVGVNEHHQNAYGTMPSPNLMAAALVRRTKRAKIAVLGNAIALREHPLRVAEEIAMLDVMANGRDPDRIDERALSSYLYTAGQPDPDLLIRTSGEMRVSNFLLWQIAYAEIWVTDVLWPDFRRKHLLQAVADFQKRERRYGGITPA